MSRELRDGRTDFEIAVKGVLEDVGPGDIVTYGEVADEAGYPGAARAVGSVLRRCGESLPWWRVISQSGRLLTGHEQIQAHRLRQEGIEVRGSRVVHTPCE